MMKTETSLRLKNFFVDFLDVKGIFNPASDILLNHQSC